jgi:hypothetical protein
MTDQYVPKTIRQRIKELQARLEKTADPAQRYLIESTIDTLCEQDAEERGEHPWRY